MTWKILYLFLYASLAPTCPLQIPLVNGPVSIPYLYITASSQYADYYGSHHIRFHYASAWCPSSNETYAHPPNMYIQVRVRMFGFNLCSCILYIMLLLLPLLLPLLLLLLLSLLLLLLVLVLLLLIMMMMIIISI